MVDGLNDLQTSASGLWKEVDNDYTALNSYVKNAGGDDGITQEQIQLKTMETTKDTANAQAVSSVFDSAVGNIKSSADRLKR